MFISPFRNPVQNPFPTEGAAAAEDWWLSGGISAGDCVAAYQAKGAASLAASYSNLNNPGTYDITAVAAPAWDTVSGWIFGGNKIILTNYTPLETTSIIIRATTSTTVAAVVKSGGGTQRFGFEASSGNKTIFERGNFAHSSVFSTSVVLSVMSNGNGYIDGVFDKTISFVGGMPTGYVLPIGGRNNSGVYGGYAAFNCQSFSMYNNISVAQMQAVTNAMNLL